jgi:hypothetical protein
MWSKSHWPPAGGGHKVDGMNLPGEPANERRAVPRHIRDGEHDSFEDTLAGVPPVRTAKSRLAVMLICVAVALVAATCAWYLLR